MVAANRIQHVTKSEQRHQTGLRSSPSWTGWCSLSTAGAGCTLARVWDGYDDGRLSIRAGRSAPTQGTHGKAAAPRTGQPVSGGTGFYGPAHLTGD